MEKELKRRILFTLFGVVMLLFIIVGTSYALFSSSASGTKENTIKSGCLKVEVSDKGSINIKDAVPVTDEDGLKSTPYEFSITNTCNTNSFYMITLNVMNDSNLENLSKIKVSLSGDSYIEPTIESDLEETYLIDTKVKGVKKTYKLDTGTLAIGQTKNFKLCTWIDYSVEEISGKLENKVIINNTAQN